jgi:putative Holliday junction resolvase
MGAKIEAELKKPHWQREGPEGWTDYTRYALGIDDRDPSSRGADKPAARLPELVDRRRSLGVDFGPEFVGLSMSLGSTNTVPLGTLSTGEDWKETVLTIAQTASTRRIQDIVIGLPLEVDGSDGKIAMLVRYFSQLLADACLLMLGPHIGVYLWDERFSTTYAAMRLVTRPQFYSGSFKSWLDGQRGLEYNAKALLDAEAARAILEHWLEGDPTMGPTNKERSERVAPSRESVREYLTWKRNPLLAVRRPVEPQGPGKEAIEWDDMHPEYEERSRDARVILDEEERFHRYIMNQRRDNRKARKDETLPRHKPTEDDSELKKHLAKAMGMPSDRPGGRNIGKYNEPKGFPRGAR